MNVVRGYAQKGRPYQSQLIIQVSLVYRASAHNLSPIVTALRLRRQALFGKIMRHVPASGTLNQPRHWGAVARLALCRPDDVDELYLDSECQEWIGN